MERIKYMGQIENAELSSIKLSVQISRKDLKNLQFMLKKYCELNNNYYDIRDAVQLETEIDDLLEQSLKIHETYE